MKLSLIARSSSVAALVTTALAFGAVAAAPAAVAGPGAGPGTAAVDSASPSADYPSAGQGTPTSQLRSNGLAAQLAAAKPITRSETLKRAATWVDQGLEYSMGGETYQGWRTDCSGYVSMAWGLPGPGETTDSFIPEGIAHRITKDELKPGDALDNPNPGRYGHVVLFEKWADADKSSYWGYEFNSRGVFHHVIPYPYFNHQDEYEPIRLNSIVDDEVTPVATDDTSRIKGDFDGDGRDDVAVLYDYGKDGERNHSGLWTFTSKGAGFNAPRQVWDSGSDSWNWASSKVTVGDFNGDGKADIGVLYDLGRTDDGRNRTRLYTFTSTGSGFTGPQLAWDSSTDAVSSWNWATSKPVVGDFNGDGKADIGVVYDYGQFDTGNRTAVWTFTSTGAGFAGPKLAWDSATDAVKSWKWTNSKPVVGDFNGDGRTDIGVLYDYGQKGDISRTGLWTLSSNGTGFNSPQQVWDSSNDAVKSWNWAASKPVSGDFNGDGKADIGVLYDYGKDGDASRTAVWTFNSTGAGFTGPKKLWDSSNDAVKSWNWNASKLTAGDFNGDGKADIGVLYDYGKDGDASRTGLWTLSSTGTGLSSPQLAWDSSKDAVKSWNWNASKLG
ncbi:C40 family peptidase [Streptomyces sp. 1331.2]|uniref:C40 family peptidase n=1 Tax=Streptomyces sp. 1331.2 TaxID=1938835 RepID=UPI000BCABF1A|nr:VCBS repeat-containing protein [Streptomyces sp. 1331.2]SOB88951.1 Repeat domain-containing protein [Streptomyces sp. 1331.2]